MKRWFLAALLALSTIPALGQTSVRQSGSVTPGHAVRWIANGTIADAGTATQSFLSSIGVTNNGGPGICLNTAPITQAYNQLCLQASTSGNATISYNAFGGAAGGGITFNINGTDSSFATVNLPVGQGDFACFANTGGTLEACGGGFSLPLPVTSGGTGLDTFAQGDLIYSNAPNDLARLAKDINATRYLSNTGTSNNPAWAQVDLSNGVVIGGATDNSALRANGSGSASVQTSPLIIADTTGSLSRDGDGGIPIQGTNTNNDAAAGYVGEYVNATITAGSAVSLTNATAANVTSISLTAGDWDVNGIVQFTGNSATTVTAMVGSLSATSDTLDQTGVRYNIKPWQNATLFNLVTPVSVAIVPSRFALSSTTTIYLVAQCNFAVNTCSAYGSIRARRMR